MIPVEEPALIPTAPAVERVRPPRFLVKMINPVMRRVLSSPLHGLVSRHVLLLELTGRRTGRRYAIPVGHFTIDGLLTVITNSGWRRNLRDRPDVSVTLRGQRHVGYATVVEDPDAVAAAYLGVIERLGWQAAQRRLGIKISVGRIPTTEELADAVRRSGLSLIRLDLR
jgi:deazaflavin-dependent oxidoreductase (nitroreductase family)